VVETAKRGITTFDGILQLQRSMDERLEHLGGRAQDAKLVIDSLYTRPIIDVEQVKNIIGKSKVSAYKLIADLEKADVLTQLPNGRRAKMYTFKEYLDLFKGEGL
jgi:Fic family protein